MIVQTVKGTSLPENNFIVVKKSKVKNPQNSVKSKQLA